MRIIVMGIIALLSYALQSTIFANMEIYNIKPNLVLITTVSFALVRGKEEGAIYGLFSGLLMDVMGGKIIGLYALMGMYLGLFIGSLNKRLYNENYIIVLILTAGGSFVYNLLYFCFLYIFVTKSQFLFGVAAYIIPETVYNAVLSVFVYFLVLYVNKKLDYYSKSIKVKKHLY